MQKFFEQLASVVGASLQWLDEEQGIETKDAQEMEIDFDAPMTDASPLLWVVDAANWKLFVRDYWRTGNYEVYYSMTQEGYCNPECTCSFCQQIRRQDTVTA